jgi:hypothetical protein
MPNREACISMNLQHAVETAGVECRKLLKGKRRHGEPGSKLRRDKSAVEKAHAAALIAHT